MTPLRLLTFLLISLALAACGGGGGGSDTGAGTSTPCTTPIARGSSNYLMAFHACDTSTTDCGNPQNHMIYLARSDDGVSWTLLTEFTPRSGSVPDIAVFQDYLYIFHAGQSETWAKLNACGEAVDSGNASLSGGSDTAGFVDPSLIVNGSELEMFYLPGIMGQDPAQCAGGGTCTKEIHSATTTGGNPNALIQQSGYRVQQTLNTPPDNLVSFSDPDIVPLDNGSRFLLYVSAGQSVLAYEGTSLDTVFTIPGGGTSQRLVSNNSGGVASGLQVTSGDVWLYVTSNQGGKEVIRRGVSSDGITQIADANFSTVVDAAIFGGSASDPINVSSPSVISWDDLANWAQ